jgi:hypothetical protein
MFENFIPKPAGLKSRAGKICFRLICPFVAVLNAEILENFHLFVQAVRQPGL